jgi:excisionase family DNA binding protein
MVEEDAGEQRRTLGNLLTTLVDRRDASLWLAHSRKISSSPLVSGNIQTAADVRCRAPSDVRRRCLSHTINSCPVERCANRRAHVRYNRREKTGGQLSQVSLSAPKAAEPSTMPFARRLTCTIDEACEVTGLGRTKLYELIGAGRIVTTTIGRRRLDDALHRAVACPAPAKSTKRANREAPIGTISSFVFSECRHRRCICQ